jgi:hypothetical protein
MSQSAFEANVQINQQIMKRVDSSDSTISNDSDGNRGEANDIYERDQDGHDEESDAGAEGRDSASNKHPLSSDKDPIPSNEEPAEDLVAVVPMDLSEPTLPLEPSAMEVSDIISPPKGPGSPAMEVSDTIPPPE